jgi:hypothetical protein
VHVEVAVDPPHRLVIALTVVGEPVRVQAGSQPEITSSLPSPL